MLKLLKPWLVISLMLISTVSFSASKNNLQRDISLLKKNWAIGVYQIDANKRKSYFKRLRHQVITLTNKHAGNSEIWIWHGIITGTYAEEIGGLKALRLVKQSKLSFEKSIQMNPNALNGLAFTSLGLLYDRVPGWPIGFGDPKKARHFLQIGIRKDPKGIDSNYFYGVYLINHGHKVEGIWRLKKALKAPLNQEHIIADKGRREEIRLMLYKSK